MSRHTMKCGCWCLLFATSLTTSVVRADALDAKDLFAQGRQLRLEGRCASALPLFRRAYDVYPAGLGSLRNIAECEEALGHFVSARGAWLDLQRALVTSNESKYEGWEQDAAQAAARLVPKLASLTIEVHTVTESGKPTQATGIRVNLNGEVLSPDAVGRPVDRDPGRYVVTAVGAAGLSEERIVDLSAGEKEEVVLRLVVPPAPDRDTTTSPANAQRTAAWFAMGVGAASLVGAGIAAFKRQSALDDLRTECHSTTTCTPAQGDPMESSKVQGIEDSGHAAATWANVLTVVGVVGLSSGVVLYVTGRTRSSRTGLLWSPAGIAVVGSY